ncbi:MAG TPA: M48 family metalloprotease [Burkholderiales bacterium]
MLIRKLIFAALAAAALLGPRAFAQTARLPDLGGTQDLALSPSQERRLGESIVRDIRAHDATFVDDPEISEYLAGLGSRLTRVATGVRYDFDFFVLRDPQINAFALPGGFVFVNTGLITLSDTESELASVLGHEIGHVTQRHIARMFGQQQQMQIPMLAALAAALILGRGRPDLVGGAAAMAQAGMVQSQLSYSRDYEREADRVGLQTLEDAGFDPRAMAAFFEKLQRATRIQDDGTLPSYMRSHPVTSDRIADAQNKAANFPYRQHVDSPEFFIVRAKLRAEQGDPADAVAFFEGALRDKRYANETAAHYGYAYALLRARRARDADAEVSKLRASGASDPMIVTLAARAKRALKDNAGALSLLETARTRYPYSRSILYAYADALQEANRKQDAVKVLADAVRSYPRDARLHGLLAQAYAGTGKRLLQHQEQAEYYALLGNLPGEIEQLQLARAAGDGDFYQLSVIDARLKDLRAQHQQEIADSKR